MRIVARFVIGTAVVLFLTTASIYFLRIPIAEAAIEGVMRRAGFSDPAIEAQTVGLSGLTLSSVQAGTPSGAGDLDLKDVGVTYALSDLLFQSKLNQVAIAGGGVTVRIDETGKIAIAGWSPDPDAPSSAPPLNSVDITGLAVTLATPKGDARLDVAGAFEFARGGEARFSGAATSAGFAATSISNATATGKMILAEDGDLDLEASLKGDLVLPAGAARGIELNLTGALRSWRRLAGDAAAPLSGAGRLTLAQSTVAAASNPSLEALLSRSGGGVKDIAVSGALDIDVSNDAVTVAFVDGPLRFIADRGDLLEISSTDAPLFQWKDGDRRLALAAHLEGPVASGNARLQAAAKKGEAWTVAAGADLGEQKIGGVSFYNFNGDFNGTLGAGTLSGVAAIDGRLKSMTVGRLTISDMPMKAALDVAAIFDAQTVTASPTAGRCVDAARASFKFDQQDMDARVTDATLCAGDAPLFSIGWGADAKTRAEGVLNGKTAYYRLGKTVFDGAPPAINFSLDYTPAEQESLISGELAGGSVILNNALRLTGANGNFVMALVGETVSAAVTLKAMRIAQAASLELVAPVATTGNLRLASDIATFDFQVRTPNGVALGRGEGRHDVISGAGDAIFDSGALAFSRALQPDALFPALRGVITGATGRAEGRARFSWAPDIVNSSATIDLNDVSFQGPGVAVTRTEGVTGTLVFSNLSPATTAGEQAITIRKIDMDALKLENGEMRFALPGDNTLNIIKAEFPWFDGVIGAYNSHMVLAGGKSETTLQIDNVNLESLFTYLNFDGLSGEGTIEGVLPLTLENGKANINNGVISSKGQGVIRYQGDATDAVASSGGPTALAFDVLRELRFEKLSATLNGPLDGTINFNILFDGRGNIPVQTGSKTQLVNSPVKFRVTINAPLLALIDQAITSTDFKRQIDRVRAQGSLGEAGGDEPDK